MIGINIHQIKSISAYRFDYKDAPLKLEFYKTDTPFPTDVTLYLDNDALTVALVKAINETFAAHRKSNPDPEQDVIAKEPEAVI